MNEPPTADEALKIGHLLGQRGAFTAVSGRCSAASAQLLRRIREEKLYLPLASSWRAFCPPYLAISRRYADYLIALLNRFGPIYFELSELIGISPRQYLAIEPAVREDQLVVDGEVISFIPKNHPKIIAAVHQLLTQTPISKRRDPTPESIGAQLNDLAARGRAIANQLVDLYYAAYSRDDRERILEVTTELRLILMRPDTEPRRLVG